jgi:hypothetical protein
MDLGDGQSKQTTVKRVGTLHAIMYGMLDQPTIAETQLDSWNEWAGESYRLSNEVGTGNGDEMDWRGRFDADSAYHNVQRLRAKMVDPKLWPSSDMEFYRRWCKWKEIAGCVDWTDLIELGIQQEIPPPHGTRVAIIDEAQDFTRLELSLIRHWTDYLETLVLAFDDDQTLYHFKGASPEALIDRPVPDDHVRVLSQSYRVPVAVHALAEEWIRRVKNRAEKEYKPRPVEGAVQTLNVTTHHTPRLIESVVRDVENGMSVMILASCAYMLKPIVHALRDEALAFHNPYQQRRGDWNPLKTGSGAVGSRLLCYLKRNPEISGEGSQLHVWTARDLALWTEHLAAGVFTKRGSKKEIQDLAKDKPHDLILEDAYFDEKHRDAINAGDLDWFKANLLTSKLRAYEYAHAIAVRNPDGLRKEPKIVIGTIHSVKGGESDAVYVFPDLSPEAARRMQGTRGNDAVLRAFYVAFTRAREKLVLCKGRSDMAINWIR